MINENLKLSGQLDIVLKDKAGKIKDTRTCKNLIVNSGLAYIASRMKGTDKAVMSHMALGSSTTAPAEGQTDLISMLGSRESLDSTVIEGANDHKIKYTCGFETGDATGAITEAGIFNAASGGDMLCRTKFSVVNKAAEDTMSVTWTITLSAS
jgi:hypothetical protein